MPNIFTLICGLFVVLLAIYGHRKWSISHESPVNSIVNSTGCFRAAVYEHSPKGDESEPDALTGGPPRAIVEANLVHFFEAIRLAGQSGANIIVLPEDSLLNSEKYSRDVLINEVLEPMPEPGSVEADIVLCTSGKWAPTSVLKRISCAAIENRIWIAFSFGDKVPCLVNDERCPGDSHYLYNTLALFSDEGKVVTKYHKMQLYHEHQYNVPSDCSAHASPVVVYDAPFGRLGFAVCFDSLFGTPIHDSLYLGVDTILYTTYWFNYWPFNVAVQVQQSLALTLDVNFLASNVHNPGYGNYGSGIYRGLKGYLVYTNAGDGVSRLLLADLPKKINSRAKCPARPEVKEVWRWPRAPPLEYHMAPEMFTRKRLVAKQDQIEVCVPGTETCCSLFYRVKDPEVLQKSQFHLLVGSGLFPGLGAKPYPLYQEFCGIAACVDPGCKEYSKVSSVEFTAINLKARFESPIAYPTVMGDGARLMKKKYWKYSPKGALRQTPDWAFITISGRTKILLVTLYGRLFDKDPPYKH